MRPDIGYAAANNAHPVFNLPGDTTGEPPGGFPLPAQGLIEATSNFGLTGGVDCARSAGAFKAPIMRGARPAAISAAFLTELRPSGTRTARIDWIRFFRSAPVTPETQRNGDST